MELREHNWVPRKAFLDNGPKTINQIRQDAVKVSVRCKIPCFASAYMVEEGITLFSPWHKTHLLPHISSSLSEM